MPAAISDDFPRTTRFVVLRHEQREGLHYDLMILTGSALATWKCPQPPETAEASPLACTRIGDHRLVYLDYEGPVSGDRGEVSRHDQGTCVVEEFHADLVRVVFEGGALLGRFALERRQALDNLSHCQGQADDQSWFLRFLGA